MCVYLCGLKITEFPFFLLYCNAFCDCVWFFFNLKKFEVSSLDERFFFSVQKNVAYRECVCRKRKFWHQDAQKIPFRWFFFFLNYEWSDCEFNYNHFSEERKGTLVSRGDRRRGKLKNRNFEGQKILLRTLINFTTPIILLSLNLNVFFHNHLNN